MRCFPPTHSRQKGGFAYGAVHKRKIATVCVANSIVATAIHLQHKQRYTQFAHPAVAQALPQRARAGGAATTISPQIQLPPSCCTVPWTHTPTTNKQHAQQLLLWQLQCHIIS